MYSFDSRVRYSEVGEDKKLTLNGIINYFQDIETSHEIIDKIERDAVKKLGLFLVIHMDPVAVKDERVAELKEQVISVLQEIDSHLSLHDFRVVDGEEQINLIFDVVVPHSYTENEMKQLRRDIVEKVNQLDSRYQCVITLEYGYVAEES